MSVEAVAAARGEKSAARVLTVGVRSSKRTAFFDYEVDDRFRGTISATYPFELDAADRGMLPGMGLGIAAFVGQLCLARRIRVRASLSARAIELIAPLAEMLYDVRCWKDGRDLGPIPEISTDATADAPADAPDGEGSLDARRSCLLWSGGKDSTLSAVLLRRNSIEVAPVHITANAGVERLESAAVDRLADALRLRPSVLRFEFPQYLDLSTAYAVTWNNFPYHNTVAFGRDMALAILATPFMRHERAAFLSMGHEHDCKTAYLSYQGKAVPRNDVESVEGALALERYVQATLLPSARLLPPLAGLSEFRVLHEMLTRYASLFRLASFCFWGNNCGRCSKCLRYYLTQRVLGVEVLSFQNTPTAGTVCPELVDYVTTWRDESALFRKPVLYCIGRLIQRGDVRPGETLLERFREDGYPEIVDELDSWEAELMQVYDDPQVPTWFAVP